MDLVFLEVRYRATKGQAIESVNHLKRAKIRSVATLYLARYTRKKRSSAQGIRFDVIAIHGDASLKNWTHMKSAW